MSEKTQNGIEQYMPKYKYTKLETPPANIQQAINIIEEKVRNCEECQLDDSILRACIDEVFFLGKLRILNDIVGGDRNRLVNFADNLFSSLTKILDKINNTQEFKEKNEVNKKIKQNLEEIKQELEEEIKELDKRVDKLVEDSVDDFMITRFREELQRQWNNRLNIGTQGHFMTRMTRTVSDVFFHKKQNDLVKSKNNISEQQKDKNEEINLKSVGVLFFDLNGLKALNDMSLGKYEAGDKALKTIAGILTSDELTQWAVNLGIELIPAHHHGDEFLMGVVGDYDIDLTNNKTNFKGVNGETVENISLIKYIGDYVKQRLKEVDSEKIKEIMDFSNPEQLEKFSEFKKQLSAELQKVFDENFQYELSCSFGYATLEDGVTRNILDGFDFKEEAYETIIYKLTGRGMVEVSAKKLEKDKEFDIQERNARAQCMDKT